MTCEEFETAGLDIGVAGANGSPDRAAALEHLRDCLRCATLHENWQLLRNDLHAIGAEAADAESSARVEVRLREEFRATHKGLKIRRTAIRASWALAAAAAVIATLAWMNWAQVLRNPFQSAKVAATAGASAQKQADSSVREPATPAATDSTLMASNDAREFTLLPGYIPNTLDDGTVVQVRMQRSALGAWGLAVNEEHAADWIQVDLLVGEDGQPEAVRLPEATN